jgi:hypothetical protein
VATFGTACLDFGADSTDRETIAVVLGRPKTIARIALPATRRGVEVPCRHWHEDERIAALPAPSALLNYHHGLRARQDKGAPAPDCDLRWD